jgi:hypothetical protein
MRFLRHTLKEVIGILVIILASWQAIPAMDAKKIGLGLFEWKQKQVAQAFYRPRK